MKVISLWNPWAMLLVIGAKKYETRSWRLPDSMIDQWCLIQAAKYLDQDTRLLCGVTEPFRSALIKSKIWGAEDLPFGALIGKVKWGEAWNVHHPKFPATLESAGSNERAFGDFGPDRWAWPVIEYKRLKIPIPLLGRQGFFNYPGEIPDADFQ